MSKNLSTVVLPTPMAVLEGIRLGADGTAEEKGWGDMLVVDVGGATTDVHSIGHGYPTGENVIARGLAEVTRKERWKGTLAFVSTPRPFWRASASTRSRRAAPDFPGSGVQRGV